MSADKWIYQLQKAERPEDHQRFYVGFLGSSYLNGGRFQLMDPSGPSAISRIVA